MLLIFHMRILPPITKTGVCFFLISSKTGVLFSLKCLVRGHYFLNTRSSVLFFSLLFCVRLAVSAFARFWCTVSCFLVSLSYFLPSGAHDIRSGNKCSILINLAGGFIFINFGYQQVVVVKQNPSFLRS